MSKAAQLRMVSIQDIIEQGCAATEDISGHGISNLEKGKITLSRQ